MIFAIISLSQRQGNFVNTAVKKEELPAQLGVMLGPLFVVGIVLIMNIHAASLQWKLPLISLVGLLLCYFWRWRGCLLASAFLCIASAFELYQHPSSGILWMSLLTLSFAVSFIVTTLFLDESQAILDRLSGHNQQAEEAFTQIKELSNVHTQLESERQALALHLGQLKQELLEKEEKEQSFEKLIGIVREELMTSHSQQEKLLQELFESHQQVAILEQQVARLQDQNMQAQRAMQEAAQSALTKEIVIDKAQEGQVLHDSLVQEMKEQINTLSMEKQSLERTLTSLQNEFEELSLWAAKKSETSDDQYVEIGILKSAIEELKIEKNKYEEFKVISETQERNLNLQIESLTKKLSNVTQQIAEWQHKLQGYNSLADRYALLQGQIQEHNTKEAALRLEFDKLMHLYAQAQATNMSNANLLSDCDAFKTEISSLKQELREKEILIQETSLQKIESAITIIDEEEERKRSRELRRMEGLYRQLREQFNEKSLMLDSTRRELFCMQEKFLSLQKEVEEKEVFGGRDYEQSLYYILSITEAELNHQMNEFNRETTQLYELIDVLMKKLI